MVISQTCTQEQTQITPSFVLTLSKKQQQQQQKQQQTN
jgi:hypothetical protein